MRLLNTETLRLTQFDQEPYPEYAILSHRWGDQEVSFQELEAGLGKEKDGYRKIAAFCSQASARGFKWGWVDTCGIDKTSSAELSEAINSMYKWYEQSAVCIVYLPDVTALVNPDGSKTFPDFDKSCWFERGWTLQELIAPHAVKFYTSDWVYIGDKRSYVKELSRITGVDTGVLLRTDQMPVSSVATIMSWASRRVTTRKEDIAYCLLGLFGIHMPLLYGEGDRAFVRLQEEILKQSSDQSLFAWNPIDGATHNVGFREYSGIFAPSPACFVDSGDIKPLSGYWGTESTLTNRGVRLRMPFKYDEEHNGLIGILCCASRQLGQVVAIEFAGSPTSYDDIDMVVRRATPLRSGSWFADQQVQLKQVYLATVPSRRFEEHFELPKCETSVLVDDTHNIVAHVEAIPDLFPPEAKVGGVLNESCETTSSRPFAVLDLLEAGRHKGAVLIRTKLSQNIAVAFGFKISNGVLDVRHLWHLLLAVDEGKSSADLWSNSTELISSGDLDASTITIDTVCITAKIEQPWWSPASTNIRISFDVADTI
jgi:Heterokaryon incompatibility protein (HET)